MPGSIQKEELPSMTIVASAMIKPALARCVVFGHERRGIVIGIGTATRKRGHEDAVGEVQSADGEWGEEVHGSFELRGMSYEFKSAWILRWRWMWSLTMCLPRKRKSRPEP